MHVLDRSSVNIDSNFSIIYHIFFTEDNKCNWIVTQKISFPLSSQGLQWNWLRELHNDFTGTRMRIILWVNSTMCLVESILCWLLRVYFAQYVSLSHNISQEIKDQILVLKKTYILMTSIELYLIPLTLILGKRNCFHMCWKKMTNKVLSQSWTLYFGFEVSEQFYLQIF